MWRRRPQGGGSGRPFRETRPRGPPPRLSTPCPLVRPLLHLAVGPRARRAPRRAVDVAGGRGARQLAGRKRRPAPPGKAEVSGEVTAGGEHRSHQAPGAPIACGPAAPAPGGSGWAGRQPAGPRRRRGHVAPAWLQPSREGGRLASGPHRRERLVTPAKSAVRCPSRWFPRGALGLQAYLRGEGPGCGGRDGSVTGPSAWRSAPSAWCPSPPAPVFRETRPHQGAGFHLRAPVPRSGTQGAPCDRCCGEGAGEAPARRTGLPS